MSNAQGSRRGGVVNQVASATGPRSFVMYVEPSAQHIHLRHLLTPCPKNLHGHLGQWGCTGFGVGEH